MEIGCSAISAPGDPIRNLTLQDFRLAADGQQQKLEHFDASTEPAHLALVLDASPSEFHSLSDMKAAARALTAELSPKDQVAVVAFAGHPHMLVPFTSDRKQLDTALEKIELMRAIEETGSNIYGSVYLTAQRLFAGPKAPSGRKAILLLTDGQDSALGLSWNPASMFPPTGALANRLTFEDVVRELATSGIEVFVASTENRPRGMTNAWFSANSAKTLINEDSRTHGNSRVHNFSCGTCASRWRWTLFSPRVRHAQRSISPNRRHAAHSNIFSASIPAPVRTLAAGTTSTS